MGAVVEALDTVLIGGVAVDAHMIVAVAERAVDNAAV